MMNDSRITIESRRYIGCKAKLVNWIEGIIDAETENVSTFCDFFAGTAVISKMAIRKYPHVIINDFLFSNNVIYKAFFGGGVFDCQRLQTIIDEFNSIDETILTENYFSKNFGNKYFSDSAAKKIGYIRQEIENRKQELSEKEYCILLSSLVYCIDRIANTLGHYEAYIKDVVPSKTFTLRLIDANSCDNVEIFQSDSNVLARKIKTDIAYIDPPYNSRQYSRFYHLYETLIKWDFPQLSGIAMKPKEENMSDYCSSRAPDAFADLIEHLDAKYIIVSYNNTYYSKSSSSKNKITLEQIQEILSKKGETKIYEHNHPCFNAGKTVFDNHKELLFITNVYEK